ncbi:MAG: chemotaxis protein CheW [Burkholderiales bacterium]|nr:chemotaxis protein CheW [Burkholderiales bacterium]
MSTPTQSASGARSVDLSQFHTVFFEEADEHLASMESLLLEIDVEAASQEDLNAIFRAAHSIKGGAGMFGFADVSELTHEAETLLDLARNGSVRPTVEIVDALLETRDLLKNQLAVHRGEQDVAPDASALVLRLRALCEGGTGAASPNPPVEAGYGFFEPAPAPADEADYGFFDDAAPAPGAAPSAAPVTAEAGDGYGFFSPLPEPDGATTASPAPPVVAAPPSPARPAAARADRQAETASIRVPVSKVDQLINLVGELVITQAMLAQNATQVEAARHQQLLARMADLERNTRDLQESVMSIRMMPIAMVFNRFPRMLRDLATKLGKKVELKMVGEGTELDKGLIEKIIDPMTHLVRNSLDHGIELPDARAAAGKSETGTITLSASHRGGNIVIEVADDGAGLRRDRILAKARERGIAVPPSPSDGEVWNLIFEPGFSTAEVVTDVSGRGVGMDVVRRNISTLGGSVDIESAAGAGTRMTVRLPLTLAIMDGMSIAIGGEVYILPLASVVESLQADARALRPVSGQGRVLDVRGEYLPVLKLAEVFPPATPAPPRGTEMIVIVEADGVKAALVVDELVGQHQVVVKSLETNYRRQPGISGATIMGDGHVALILDVAALIKKTRH